MRIKVAFAENLQPLKIPSLKSTAGQNKDLYALPTEKKSFFFGVIFFVCLPDSLRFTFHHSRYIHMCHKQ